MWNASEVPSTAVQDRYLQAFLCKDYFHDSDIRQIILAESARSIVLIVDCEREGAQGVRRGSTQFLYRLEFFGCTHFELAITNLPCTYLCGRFKLQARHDSPVGSKRQRAPYYLRIEVVDEGPGSTYIDIQFQRFKISRERGRVNLPAVRAFVGPPLSSVAPWADRPIAVLRRIAATGSCVDRAFALAALAVRNDRRSVSIAESCLRSTDHDLLATAVHAVGLLGSQEQVPQLAKVLRRVSSRIARRQVLEAIARASRR